MPVAPEVIQVVVDRALREDLGSGDITTQATVPPGTRARAVITQKAPGVVYGLDCAERAFRTIDPEVALEGVVDEGVWHEPKVEVLRIELLGSPHRSTVEALRAAGVPVTVKEALVGFDRPVTSPTTPSARPR